MKVQHNPPIIKGSTFIISDLHFGHKNVDKFEKIRPTIAEQEGYTSSEEMIIAKWNATIKPDDEVLILGDYAFKGIPEYTKRLNGVKYLIRGNHDRSGSHAYYDAEFDYVYDSVVIQDGQNTYTLNQPDTYISGLSMMYKGEAVFLSHYPLDFYEDHYTERRVDLTMRVAELTKIAKSLHTEVNIHGHTHSLNVERGGNPALEYINVSCENLQFIPKTLDDIMKGN